MKNSAEIQADFDRIALAQSHEGWNHNNHYHEFLLRHAPPACADALEVGCGTGDFARLLAQRSAHVLALDSPPVMLRLARAQSATYPNIDYVQADVMTAELPAALFDCVASIATLHHMPLQDVLPKLKAALKPGGALLVLDLFRAESIGDLVIAAAGVPVNQVLKRTHHANVQQSPEAQAAWDAHGRTDVYPTPGEVRCACTDLLPGARVRRHLLWRYSLVWTKPAV